MQEEAWEAHGSDVIEMDDSVRTFTFANHTKGEHLKLWSTASVGTDEAPGCLWCTSPTLLGQEYLRTAEARVTHEWFLFGDGHREP